MIGPLASSTSTAAAGVFVESGTEGLGRDAFLRLLITQMQMQDPLEPMKAQDFIAQLAQFSTLEALETANLQLAILQQAEVTSQAVALIGRTIATVDDEVTGVVEAVTFSGGQPKLLVDGTEVDPGDVVRVW